MVRVSLRCSGCGHEQSWCVRVDRPIPPELQCRPGGGGGAGGPGVRCPRCRHECFATVRILEKEVEARLRGEWGRLIQQGSVVVEC